MKKHSLFTGAAALRRALPLLALLLLASAVAGCYSQAAEEPTPNSPLVSVALVAEHQVILWDDFNGRIEAVDSVALRPRVSGYIQKVNYQEGQIVKR